MSYIRSITISKVKELDKVGIEDSEKELTFGTVFISNFLTE